MKILYCFMLFFLIPNILSAKSGKLKVDKYCAFNDVEIPKEVITFSSDEDAKEALMNIMSFTGLEPNFTIMAFNVPNAAAVIQNNKRYILYNQYFMAKLKDRTKNQWSKISVLAHEIGHHLNAHTLENTGSRPEIELEADSFSGYVLQRMGATLDDAVITMQKISGSQGSTTHPGRNARVAAVSNGWKKAEYQSRKKVQHQKKCIRMYSTITDFDGDGCFDMWRNNTNSIAFMLGNGQSFYLSPSTSWRGSNGVWLSGDFNGDHRADLIQIVTGGVTNPDYAHVFCSIQNENSYELKNFNFRKSANPQGDYCVSCGSWSTRTNANGLTDLVHNSNLPPYSIHKWVSNGFCGSFSIR